MGSLMGVWGQVSPLNYEKDILIWNTAHNIPDGVKVTSHALIYQAWTV